MAIDRSGKWWKGTEPADLDEFLSAYSAGGYPVAKAAHARCGLCGREEFAVLVDDEEGCAVRVCASCRDEKPLLDSQEYLADAALESAACPCGGEVFNVAVGFALYDGSEDVRWVYLGLRRISDGVLGNYADWKIDYSPSSHLVHAV